MNALDNLRDDLGKWPSRIIACSGGIDSLLLATIAFREAPGSTVIAHAGSAAVPQDASDRLRSFAHREGWNLQVVKAGEFDDSNYVANPVDRCFYCKSNLYNALRLIANTAFHANGDQPVLMSGTNLNDLREFRPGLRAATIFGVHHPFVSAGIGKEDIRQICRDLGLPIAELPSSPCLASRLFTGTKVTSPRVRAIDRAEALIRQKTGIHVVRCRLREDLMFVEVEEGDRAKITSEVLAAAGDVARNENPQLVSVTLDPEPYRPGRAFIGAP